LPLAPLTPSAPIVAPFRCEDAGEDHDAASQSVTA